MAQGDLLDFNMPVPARFLTELIEHEGSVPHMYLDTRGHVTVGVGLLLASSREAEGLGFVERHSGRPASRSEIQLDWQRVRGEPAGRVAADYERVTRLELPAMQIRRELSRRVDQFQVGLRRTFENYDRYPDDVRLALLDMAFNLGLRGLTAKFPKFCGAIRRGDWPAAAKESARRGIASRRNEYVRTLLAGTPKESSWGGGLGSESD